MLFNSITFIIFLPIVFTLYWLFNRISLKAQNLLLLFASYIFYGWWDWRFLGLIVFSSTVDYYVGLCLSKNSNIKIRKLLLISSLAVNLGLLGFFKYFGFFVDSMVYLIHSMGISIGTQTLNIILPVGISFYTFQTLSYTIDVYRNKLKPTKDVIAFFAFVSFFPQLVAGPIERAHSLLPQFLEKRSFDPASAEDGLRQMLWGMFKKVVIADYVAQSVDTIFLNYQLMDGITLISGSFLFAIQIYCDFSGYSDIAIGTARLFGFNLMRNFAFPYFSRDMAEFWRRWHISLSSWFRDYVYIPLGGSYSKTSKRIINILITFSVSGLWHGANWTFIAWGLLNGIYYIPLLLSGKQKQYTDVPSKGRTLPTINEFARMFNTMLLAMLAWVFFRSESLTAAFMYFRRILTNPTLHGDQNWLIIPLLASALLLMVEWMQREKEHALQFENVRLVPRWVIYQSLGVLILLFSSFGNKEFIYFQF